MYIVFCKISGIFELFFFFLCLNCKIMLIILVLYLIKV